MLIDKAHLPKSWAEHIDAFRCLDQIMTGVVDAVIVEETYLLVYDVGAPWYSKDIILAEMLVLKVYEGGARFHHLAEALEQLARENEATAITVGTALAQSDAALSRLYKRHGFQIEAYSLYKPIKEL